MTAASQPEVVTLRYLTVSRSRRFLTRQAGVDACLDTAGLGSRALGCVRDGGAFLTSVTTVPGAMPDVTRGTSPQTVAVQPDADATAELADLCPAPLQNSVQDL